MMLIGRLTYRRAGKDCFSRFIAAYWGKLYIGCYYNEGYIKNPIWWNTNASALFDDAEGPAKSEQHARHILEKMLDKFLAKTTTEIGTRDSLLSWIMDKTERKESGFS